MEEELAETSVWLLTVGYFQGMDLLQFWVFEASADLWSTLSESRSPLQNVALAVREVVAALSEVSVVFSSPLVCRAHQDPY